MRGATTPCRIPFYYSDISTHAPRAGSDRRICVYFRGVIYFNPRSPCGERPIALDNPILDTKFQPTLPVRGATSSCDLTLIGGPISTHAPRAGSDVKSLLRGLRNQDFNPRSPCGERLSVNPVRALYSVNFNPRSPCGERPPVLLRHHHILLYFNPRSPCGERHLGEPSGTYA